MNIVNKLTLRSMLQNKRRTLVTIVGVIISVAMIMAVATISISFLELMKKQEVNNGGNWHISYSGITTDQAQQIAAHKQTKILSMMSTPGYAKLEQSKHQTKPYLKLTNLNAMAYEQFTLKLVEGRLPAEPNEVVITDEIKRIGGVDFPIGTQLQLATGKRLAKDEDGNTIELPSYMMYGLKNRDGQLRYEEWIDVKSDHEVTVVGVVKQPNWQSGAAYFSVFGLIDDKQLSTLDTAATLLTAYVVNDKVSNHIYSDGRKVAEEIGFSEEQVSFHNGLLRYDGVTHLTGFKTVLYSLSAIIIAIIMIGSISLIYNAFAISVSERSRYLGMLSSVGATKSQKRNSVFFESSVIALISIPLGLFFGWLGISITFFFVNHLIQSALEVNAQLVTIVTPGIVSIAILVSLFTIFISAYIPARRASRISAIEAIRQTTDIKLSAGKVRTLPLVRKLFGMEADIALKNLKRNKRKYQITVFSIVISIVLFLSVSYFTDVLKKTMQLTQTDVSYDLVIYSMPEEKQDEIVARIATYPTVETYSLSKQFGMLTVLEQEQHESATINPARPEEDRLTVLESDGKFHMPVHFLMLDDASLLQYATSVGVDGQELIDSKQPKMIVQQTISYKDDLLKKYIEGKVIKAAVGERLAIQTYESEENGTDEAVEVEVAALVNKLPIGYSDGQPENLYVVISMNTAKQVLGEAAEFHQYPYTMHIISNDPLQTEEQLIEEQGELYVNNVYKARQREKQMIVLMSVFTYGFIALISAVVVANIFNTISTSIALRKREFAMLQSIGMTPQGFNKMIQYESIFYGLKALLYGLPISIIAMYVIYRSTDSMFDFPFQVNWIYIAVTIIFVLTIVLSTMLYAGSKVKRENIIDVLKQENI